jgi:hypothetical protein
MTDEHDSTQLKHAPAVVPATRLRQGFVGVEALGLAATNKKLKKMAGSAPGHFHLR